MAELMIYDKPQVFNRQKHGKLRYTPPKDYSFAKNAVAVPLMAVEFPVACRNYPIVFSGGAKDQLVALAILSLDKSGNSFVDDKGRWTARYIPAFIRRYPFVLADIPNKKDDFAVAFDSTSTCFSTDKGEALFNDKGEATDVLKGQVQFLQRFHAENKRTGDLLKTLRDEKLLRPINVDVVRGKDQAKFGVRNALVVDEQALQKLAADKAQQFLSTGLLAAAYAQLISLRNFEAIANRTGNPSEELVPWWAK